MAGRREGEGRGEERIVEAGHEHVEREEGKSPRGQEREEGASQAYLPVAR